MLVAVVCNFTQSHTSFQAETTNLYRVADGPSYTADLLMQSELLVQPLDSFCSAPSRLMWRTINTGSSLCQLVTLILHFSPVN